MAVQLNNAPAQQDYMQVPPPQASGHQPARNAAQAAAGARDGDRRDEQASDFQQVMNSLRKTANELWEKSVKPAKKAEGKAADGAKDTKAELAAETDQDLSALVNPLMKGMEHLKQLIESMQAELKEGDVKNAFTIAQNAAAKASRFDPDLVLGKDFVDGALGQKLQEFLAEVAEAGAIPAGSETAAGEAALAEGDAGTSEAAAGSETLPKGTLPDAGTVADAGSGTEEADAAQETPDGLAEELLESVGQNKELTAVGEELGEEPAENDAPAEAKPDAFAALADELFGASRDARSERASRKLAALADELLNAVETPSPELAAQLKALRDKAEGGLSAEEAKDAAAELEEIVAKVLGDAENSANPLEGYENQKEDLFGSNKMNKMFSSDRQEREATSRARERSYQTASAWDLDRERASRGDESPRDFAASVSASLKGAAAETFETRAASNTSFGQPGVTYMLDPDDAFGDGMTKMLEFLRDEEISEARIVVEPPALGRIDVSVQARAGGVEAVFKVDNEQLKQVLQQQLDSLKSSLQAQGIHVSGLAVDIKNRDDHRRQDAQETGKDGKRVRRLGGAGALSGEGDEDGAATLVRLDLEKGLLHWVA